MFSRLVRSALIVSLLAGGTVVSAAPVSAPPDVVEPDAAAGVRDGQPEPDTGSGGELTLKPVPPALDEPSGATPDRLVGEAGDFAVLPKTDGGVFAVAVPSEASERAQVGEGLPILVGSVGSTDRELKSPEAVRVEVLPSITSQTVGIVGLAFQVDAAEDGTSIAVELDYSAFRGLYGGDFGGRLQLVRYPACVLTSPKNPQCNTAEPVKGATNDNYALTVSGVIDVAYDATPAESVPIGDGTATEPTTASSGTVRSSV